MREVNDTAENKSNDIVNQEKINTKKQRLTLLKKMQSHAGDPVRVRYLLEDNTEYFYQEMVDKIQSSLGDSEKLKTTLGGLIDDIEFFLDGELFDQGIGHVVAAGENDRTAHAYLHQYSEKEIETNGLLGTKAVYDNYKRDEKAGFECAYVSFDTPIQETVGEKGLVITPQGVRNVGDGVEKSILGANIRLNRQGMIDFSLSANIELLKHPKVVAEIIKHHPEAFRSVPSLCVAENPRLFVSKYGEGVKEAANSKKARGTMSKEAYYKSCSEALDSKLASIEKTVEKSTGTSTQEIMKDFNAQLGQE